MSNAFSLLISDLHLCEDRGDIADAFERFCAAASAASALYILGDLSDAWVGDDDDSVSANRIRTALQQLSASGTKVLLMTGNRDFLMGQQLARDCGAGLLEDPSVVELHGQRCLLMHGDSLCTDDAEYMAFRAQIRNPRAQQMLLEKPLEERRQIAAMLRMQSKSANATKAEDIMDVNPQAVEQAMADHQVDLLIHGHTHRPQVHQLQSARRMVLGDWDTSLWYIRADREGQQLHCCPLAETPNFEDA